MHNLNAVLLLALCGVTPQPPEKIALDVHDWWSAFVREMGAIGCINIRQNIVSGEWEFDCPAERIADAKRIVQRYKATHA